MIKNIFSSNPLFSVIIPTFNRPLLLHRSITSVLAQSLGDFELIVVDDGSSVPCGSNIEIPVDHRIRVITNRIQLGAAAARNIGIKHARGRYISFLDDDDEFLPKFLEETKVALESGGTAGNFSWSNVEYVKYMEGRTVTCTRRPPPAFENITDIYGEVLSLGSGHGITINTEYIKEIGGFNEAIRLVEDTDLFLRLLEANVFPTFVPIVGVRIHHHDLPRMTSTHLNAERAKECMTLLSRYSSLLDSHPPLRRQLETTAATLSDQGLVSSFVGEDHERAAIG